MKCLILTLLSGCFLCSCASRVLEAASDVKLVDPLNKEPLLKNCEDLGRIYGSVEWSPLDSFANIKNSAASKGANIVLLTKRTVPLEGYALKCPSAFASEIPADPLDKMAQPRDLRKQLQQANDHPLNNESVSASKSD